MLKAAGLPDAEIRTLEVTPAEKIARFIAAFAPILLIIGLGGIYIEIKTPGFGLPGILGTAALVLFFFGHHIAGLAGMEDIIIFIIGFTLIFIEVFITPGFGLPGFLGIAMVLFSLLNAMTWKVPGHFLPSPNDITLQLALRNLAMGLSGTVVLGLFAGKYLPKSRVLRPMVLGQQTTRAEGFTAAHDQSKLLGKEGVTEMNLRPAGRALFDGDRINVITRGEFIEIGAAVRVIETSGSRIVVEKISAEV